MGTIKGGEGGSAKRTLYSLSWQLPDGSWINTEIHSVTTYVPPERSMEVQSMERSHAQGSYRRDTRVQGQKPWYQQNFDEISPTAAQAPQEEEQCEERVNPESSGSPPQTPSVSQETSAPGKPPVLQSPQKPQASRSPSSSRSSKTAQRPTPSTERAHSQTSKTAVTDSVESSGKSTSSLRTRARPARASSASPPVLWSGKSKPAT